MYTITFGTLSSSGKDLIENCASSPEQYFHAATGAQLQDVFKKIQEHMTSLHLSM